MSGNPAKPQRKALSRLQQEVERKGNTQVKLPGSIGMDEIQSTILRLVKKNEELELQVEKYRTQSLIKDDLIDTFLKPSWRQGQLEVRDELFASSSDEEETAQPTDEGSAERE